jgi:hypothetical protein
LKRKENGKLVDNLSEKSKALFKKYNITKDDLVNSPEKSAIATMIILGDNYLSRGRTI